MYIFPSTNPNVWNVYKNKKSEFYISLVKYISIDRTRYEMFLQQYLSIFKL